MFRRSLLTLATIAVSVGAGLVIAAQQPQDILDRAVADFVRGRIAESAAGFDQVVKLAPAVAPQLWQRGIALYYAGRYDDCREQFELHRTVNPNDVENAAWHFLCVARAESPAKARAALLPVGPDARVPMRQIYEMFRGALTPEDVLAGGRSAAAGAVLCPPVRRPVFRSDAATTDGRSSTSRLAAADRYADAGGYMHTSPRSISGSCTKVTRHEDRCGIRAAEVDDGLCDLCVLRGFVRWDGRRNYRGSRAIITSVDLMTASAACPRFSFSSSTASRVMTAVSR